MTAAIDKRLFYALSLVYMAAMYYALKNGYDFLQGIPLLILVITIGLLRLELLFYICVLLVPFSINYSQTNFGIGMSLPSEPIIFGTMILIIMKWLMEGGSDIKFFRHPLSLLVFAHIIWMFITTITSEMVLVSFKFAIARLTFVIVFYYYASQVFIKPKNISAFIWSYVIMLLGVVGYTIVNHGLQFFSQQAAHNAMSPFYNDHTAYAAALSLIMPLMLSIAFSNSFKIGYRVTSFATFIVLAVAIVLSYTRASWLGLAAALGLSFIFIFKIPSKLIWGIITVVTLFVALNFNNIVIGLETNREQSSTDFGSHLLSMLNIRTDPSNVERINRWSCAIRMFNDRPVMGYGPGTYQFIYGAYQISWQRTSISTNEGNRGNAHSEYLGPLAEQGFMGSLLFIAIAIATVITGSRFIINSKSKRLRALAIGLLLGLITYWIHGLINNFLDTEKLSVPYWGFIAAIAALDVYHRNTTDEELAEK